ncbi:MAG: YicC/YloC family endoribonuclease [Candidatus Omnitrophota bacterium]
MIKSMTGFGAREAEAAPFGKIRIELRSSNHKFLETVFHMPSGYLSLEGRIKKEIERKIKRGRVTCAINIIGSRPSKVFINKALLRDYLWQLNQIREKFQIEGEVGIDTLVHLPGILSLEEDSISVLNIWPRLKPLLAGALDELSNARSKEGKATQGFLKSRAESLKLSLAAVKARFKKAIKEKLKNIDKAEERSAFLKGADISEEIERLDYHTRNFKSRLSKSGLVGKELDFIAQEMQREANTLGAKTFDLLISGRIVQIKSQIEKIREQVQNIE